MAGPEFDALTVLRGEQHLVADRLLFALTLREEQPTARREVARDAIAMDDVAHALPVAHRDREHGGRLPLGFGVEHLDRHVRVAAAEEAEALGGESFVEPDGVLRDHLEVPAVATARLARGVALVDNDDLPARCGRVAQVVRSGGSGQPRADDEHVSAGRELRRGPEAAERVRVAQPVRGIVEGEPNRQAAGDAQGREELLEQPPCSRSELVLMLDPLQFVAQFGAGASVPVGALAGAGRHALQVGR